MCHHTEFHQNQPSSFGDCEFIFKMAALRHLCFSEFQMDRSRWRKQIGMIDDHDECEGVNVSSGTGSPGFSRTNSTEP